MSRYCTVWTPVCCPECGAEITRRDGRVNFLWGKVPEQYALGSTIQWLYEPNGDVIAPFHVTRNGEWNCGDPAFANVLVFDPEIAMEAEGLRYCNSCGKGFAAIGVWIRGGIIQSVQVFGALEVARHLGHQNEFAETVIIREDGSFWCRPDWNEPSFHVLDE